MTILNGGWTDHMNYTYKAYMYQEQRYTKTTRAPHYKQKMDRYPVQKNQTSKRTV